MPANQGPLIFRIDHQLSSNLRKLIEGIISEFNDAEVCNIDHWSPKQGRRLVVDFVSESSLHSVVDGQHLKICVLDRNQGLFSFATDIESSLVDVVLDDTMDKKQLERILAPRLLENQSLLANDLFFYASKNLKKFESLSRTFAQKIFEGKKLLTSDNFLEYAQALVDLEKDLFHAEDTVKVEKITKHFAKTHLEKSKFQYLTQIAFWKIAPSKNLLPLPKFKGDYQMLELNWEDEDHLRLVRKFFFYHTLVNFFQSKQDLKDPFIDESLWEGALDSIPFPVVLMSAKGEVHQHNTLFAKLNHPPVECIRLRPRDKVVINDIPYNVFRKEVHHLDETKILFVFFTESFFLKGDANHTPSGQELGIISSSIAHELNNPIAGIQAALTLLLLDTSLSEEATQTLIEMKNGAMRCKQLIETFLGFSRANPRSQFSTETNCSPIEVCYMQAQNLLRFRTVESGIRFSLEYSKHTDFRSSVNLSLLTMTFYLIMGELMTLYSHQLLVANKNQIEKVIKGEIVESSQEIQLQLHELNISGLSLSKLVQNLLTIENFVAQVSDYSIRFIYNLPRGN